MALDGVVESMNYLVAVAEGKDAYGNNAASVSEPGAVAAGILPKASASGAFFSAPVLRRACAACGFGHKRLFYLAFRSLRRFFA